MPTKLEQLLERIDPRCTIELLRKRADDAVNRSPIATARVRSAAEFQEVMTSYYHRVFFGILNKSPDLMPENAEEYALCVEYLIKEFGQLGTAFTIAFTGEHGGLRGLLRVVADRMVAEYSTNRIKCRISDFLNSLSVDEYVAAAAEYVEKFGHLYPPNMRAGNGYRLRVNFFDVLADHPFLVQRLRAMGR